MAGEEGHRTAGPGKQPAAKWGKSEKGKLASILAGQSDFLTASNRHALLVAAGLDRAVRSIDLEGSPLEVARRLVATLSYPDLHLFLEYLDGQDLDRDHAEVVRSLRQYSASKKNPEGSYSEGGASDESGRGQSAPRLSSGYFFNVHWLLRQFDSFGIEFPSAHCLEGNPYLAEGATSLGHGTKTRVLVELEECTNELLGRVGSIDLSEMLEQVISGEAEEGALVYFSRGFYCRGCPKPGNVSKTMNQPITMHDRLRVSDGGKVRVVMDLDPRYLPTMTSFVILAGRQRQSGLGMFVGDECSGEERSVRLRPLIVGFVEPCHCSPE